MTLDPRLPEEIRRLEQASYSLAILVVLVPIVVVAALVGLWLWLGRS
jgi:hypothetical protein